MKLACLFLGLALAPLVAAPRAELDLAGTWQMQRTTDLDQPPGEAWTPQPVPSTIGGHDYGAAWFQRTVEIPAAWAGRRIALRFGGVRWNSRVLVNGRRVGGRFNGFDAFELDVSTAVNPGATNEILVGCTDWTGVFDPAKERVAWRDGVDLREQPTDRVLAPIGGHVTMFGIWDQCALIATEPARIETWSLITDLRARRLTLRVTLTNGGDDAVTLPLAAGLSTADGTPVVAFDAAEVALEPGARREVTLNAALPELRLWSHEDPYLHRLAIRFGGDSIEAPAGVREFRVEGPDFYLNGAKMHLLASSWWPPAGVPATDDQVRERLLALKRANTHVFRTHTQPWPANWYRVADEVGILMIPEAAIWNDDGVYALDDDRFWDNYREHLEAMVGSLGHFTSVVMWSLENEMTGGRLNNATPERVARLAALADVVRAADPQRRPITYESDGDPGGAADVIGMHYPHEWPQVYQWPNQADWLPGPPANAGGGGGFLWPEPTFVWPRTKPLYIGEFLWIPSNAPDWSTLWLGDEAYRGYQAARAEAKARSWYQQILAYRRADLSGMSPWTTAEHGELDETNPTWVAHRDAYAPLAAFPREMDSRFFDGETVRRTIDVYNDTLSAHDLLLAVVISGDGRVHAQNIRLGSLQPGEHRIVEAELAPPERSAFLQTLLLEGQQVVHMHQMPVRSEPRTPLPKPGRPVSLWDAADGAGATALRRAGLDVAVQPGIAGDAEDILIVGQDALAAGEAAVPVLGEASATDRLVAFVRGGGRLLVLPHRRLPSGLFGVSGSDRASTMTFPGAAGHPILEGLAAEDLSYWRGDHLVGLNEPQRPSVGGAVPIIVSGGESGLNHAPLVEIRHGRGVAVICGMRLIDKLETEPAARRLMGNILAYLDQFAPTPGRTGLLCDDLASRAVLDGIGLDAEDLAQRAGYDGLDLAVLVAPTPAVLADPALRAFVDRGGRLLLSQLTPEHQPALAGLGLGELRLQPMAAGVTRLEQGSGPIFSGLLREDLYWLAPASGPIGWAERGRHVGQATCVAVPAVDAAAGTPYECEAMTLDGSIVRAEGDQVLFATTGTATVQVEVAEDGDYVLGITGWGTPAAGAFPTIAVAVDGLRVGDVYLGSREPDSYGLAVKLAAGTRRIALSFVNDASTATEDRNAYLDRLTVARVDEPLGMTPLTSPAALLEAEVGRGRVVLDQIRWMDAGGNGTKARRYLASVLTGLGASFRAGGGLVVEAETMRVQPGLQWTRPDGSLFRFGQAGWAELDLEVRTAGTYRLTLTGRGDAADGGWPVATLLVNGEPAGEVEIASADWADFATNLQLPAGRVTLRIDYRNDLYDQARGWDRNLLLDRLTWEPVRD